MGSFFRQLYLLVWKNYTLQKRRPIATVFEIGLPILLLGLLVVIRHTISANDQLNCLNPFGSNKCSWQPYDPVTVTIKDAHGTSYKDCDSFQIAFAPNSAANVTAIMDSVSTYLSATNEGFFLIDGFNASEYAIDFLSNQVNLLGADPGCQAAVVFDEWSGTFSYALQFAMTPGGLHQGDNTNTQNQNWFTKFAFPFFQQPGPRDDIPEFPDQYGNLPGYAQHGFLLLQKAVNYGIVNLQSPAAAALMQSVLLQRMPQAQYILDKFLPAVEFGFPMLLMLALFYTALSIVRSVVYEKEKRLKESMKMMGVSNFVQWLSWFIQYFIFLMISMIVIVILMKVGGVLRHSDPSVLLVFLMLFAMATIAFCFLLSTFFSRASTAAAAGGILWFLSYVPYLFIAVQYTSISAGTKRIVSLLSTTCMSIGANLIAAFEAQGSGVQWNNINVEINPGDPITFGLIMSTLIGDTILYIILTWYIEAVFPGEFGIPRPFYFFLTPSYWCGQKPSTDDIPLVERRDPRESSDQFEGEPVQLPLGIQMMHLRKLYGKKVAVKDTTLNFYEGQITALLGHNGAGKSTTMSMLVGLFPPTSGTASIMGHDIRTSISKAQEHLGLCPQHDVLFDSLTVEEHLWMFCRLKGISSNDSKRHINDMLDSLQLVEKRLYQTTALSGGMKRKLCCGIALIGGSKVVILDEPTSGMDPAARRATWELLLKYKKGRTILLSTHFMDEADILGDRIAIMSEGIVQCCGSSLFLKAHYGVGYHMTISKANNCNVNEVIELVSKSITGAKLEGNVGAEMSFILPRTSTHQFEAFFTYFEANKERLGVESYGASITTMEEVFLKVGEASSAENEDRINIQERIDRRHANNVNHGNESESTALLGERIQYNSGNTLRLQQFKAMLIKRFLNSIRDKYAIISQLLIPAFFTLLALIVAKTVVIDTGDVPRGLYNLVQNYGENNVLYTTQNSSYVPSNDLSSLLGDALVSSTMFYSDSIKQTFTQASTNINNYGYLSFEDYTLFIEGNTSQSQALFNKHNLIAIDFSPNPSGDVNIIALFNAQAYHSCAEALSIVSNAILWSTSPGSLIYTTNAPLPKSKIESAVSQSQDQLGFNIAFNILFGMAFLASSFVLLLVNERRNKAKHVQFVSGVDAFSYWVSAYVWDFLNYMVPTVLILILFASFGVDAFAGERFQYVVLLFVLYGLSIIPMVYLGSFFFEVPSVAYTRLTIFNIITGLAAMLTVSILTALQNSGVVIAKKAFLFLPNYCFGQGLADLYANYEALDLIGSFCGAQNISVADCCLEINLFANQPGSACQQDYLAWAEPGIGKYVTFMPLTAIVFFALVLAIELKLFRRLALAISTGAERAFGAQAISHDDEDEDVATERQRIQMGNNHSINHEGNNNNDVLQVNNLGKVFHPSNILACGTSNKSKVAVAGLTFGVKRGECFGLLGVNGAGKTTTFRMISGEETMSFGTAQIDGFDIKTDLRKVQQRIGYCPQFDALIDLMTGREVLFMYARLRGIKEAIIPSVVNDLIDELILEKHADKLTQAYSGGNKRKLSTAIALIGNPKLVFLDEPTTGMDPGARRFLWDSLITLVQNGQSVVLTTHSMEEAEALCTKTAIMVNGQFKCFGSLQHLKSRFGKGITLQAKVANIEDIPNVKQRIEQSFTQLDFKGEHSSTLQYIIYDRITWASIFSLMERIKREFNLQDYSVYQTSLEQVFIEFARHQFEEGA